MKDKKDKHDNRNIVLLDDTLTDWVEKYRADGYQRDKRVPSRSEAIRELIIDSLISKGYPVDKTAKIDSIATKPINTTVTPDTAKTPVQEKPTPKPIPATPAAKRVLPKKHDWPALWSEYQEAKAANPELSEAAFGRSKGIDKAFLSKNFKQFKALDNQPGGLSTPAVDTEKAD